MTKKQRIILLSTVAVLGIGVAYGIYLNKSQDEQIERGLGQIITEIDSLRELKQECSDNLSIEDSARFLKGESGYCDSRDEEIQNLRKELQENQEKGYERALGLVKDR